MDAARLFVRITVAGASEAQRALQGMGAQVNATQRGFDRIATGSGRVIGGSLRILERATIAAGGAFAYAAKQSISFQDAFAGVEKTVGAGAAASVGLDKALRDLSTRIPINYQDLAGIAQEAGALGVPAAKVANFTEVVSRLSAATVGLTREAAAEAFGKLGNVLGLNADATGKGYERLASSLIRLGNTAASSEGDIIEVAKRFGAAGTQAGLAGHEILGFSSAIASLGVEPEAAGSALSRTFNRITTQIGTLDPKFKVLAKTSGMTAAEFKRAWATDASGAFQTFLDHLSKLDNFQAADVLKKAGITNVRDVNLILLLSQHLDTLTTSLEGSAEAWKENTEWQTVSDTRFKTLQNSLVRFHNQIQVTAAAVGDEFTPALGRALGKLSEFVNKHQGDLVNLGKDLGRAIDDIDWGNVEKAVLDVAGAAKTILDVIRLIPPQIDLMVAGFLTVNKLTAGAAGQVAGGALDIVGGIATLGARAAGGRIGGKVGGAIGMLTSTPVYITGVAPGVMLGGGGLPGAGAGLPAAATTAFAGLATGLATLAGGVTLSVIGITALGELIKATSTPEEIATGERNVIDANRQKRTFGGIIGPQTPAVTRIERGAESGIRPEDRFQGGVTPRFDTAVLRAAMTEFTRNVGRLARATDDRHIRSEARELTGRIASGRGDVGNTAAALKELRAALRRTHDPETAAMLRTAITKVESKLASRQSVQRQLAAAEKIVHSSETSKDKIADLKTIQARFLARGDTHAATKISNMIKAENAKVATAARAAGQASASAIKEKDLSLSLTTGPTNITLNPVVGLNNIIKAYRISGNLFRKYID